MLNTMVTTVRMCYQLLVYWSNTSLCENRSKPHLIPQYNLSQTLQSNDEWSNLITVQINGTIGSFWDIWRKTITFYVPVEVQTMER